MKYSNEDELFSVLARFEDGTIPREDWGHPEHLIVAYFYSKGNSLETAYSLMKKGIFGLLTAFGIDLSTEMPYHETLTVFWITAVHCFSTSRAAKDDLENCRELVEGHGKQLPSKYYSHELLFSDKARAQFVPPNLPVSETDPVGKALRPLMIRSRISEKRE